MRGFEPVLPAYDQHDLRIVFTQCTASKCRVWGVRIIGALFDCAICGAEVAVLENQEAVSAAYAVGGSLAVSDMLPRRK